MAKKTQRGLGRGLGALLGDVTEEEQEYDIPAAPVRTAHERHESRAHAQAVPTDAVKMIPLAQIDPNRDQPRKKFDEEALAELSESIKAVGVIQPIVVCPRDDRYMIIVGERRYRASRLANLTEIPAIVRDWEENRRLEAALVENLQRDDLNPIEEAMGVRALMEKCGLTQEVTAQRIGKSRPAVTNLLRLLNLPEEIRQMLIEGKLSQGHARALISVDDAERQLKLARLTVEQGWSVRQLERICAQPVKEQKEETQVRRAEELNELERMAREVFGTRAKIDGDGQRGKLTLSYFSSDDLQRIWEIIEMVEKANN